MYKSKISIFTHYDAFICHISQIFTGLSVHYMRLQHLHHSYCILILGNFTLARLRRKTCIIINYLSQIKLFQKGDGKIFKLLFPWMKKYLGFTPLYCHCFSQNIKTCSSGSHGTHQTDTWKPKLSKVQPLVKNLVRLTLS